MASIVTAPASRAAHTAGVPHCVLAVFAFHPRQRGSLEGGHCIHVCTTNCRGERELIHRTGSSVCCGGKGEGGGGGRQHSKQAHLHDRSTVLTRCPVPDSTGRQHKVGKGKAFKSRQARARTLFC
jgi:hypothetical protein